MAYIIETAEGVLMRRFPEKGLWLFVSKGKVATFKTRREAKQVADKQRALAKKKGSILQASPFIIKELDL